MNPKSLEEWRKFFESGNCSIYEIIFNAIRVAGLDDSEQFKLCRNKIVERLYSCQFTGCCCYVDQTEQDNIHSTITQAFQDCKKACAHETTTKVDDSAVGEGGGATANQQANEGLGNNIEDDDGESIRCVLQVKDKLESNELTESEICESLRKLQLVVQSVDVMEATKIGSTIRILKSHRSKEISLLATSIADQWLSMILVELVEAVAESAEQSKNPEPSVVLEEWQEFPSVEFVPQPPVEFSEKFLDDMDDYENAVGKDNNEVEEMQNNNAGKENEAEPKKRQQESRKREKTKRESVEKFINSRSNKSHVKVEKTGATTEKKNSMGNKRKLEGEEFVAAIKRQKEVTPKKKQECVRQKPSKSSAPNPKLPKTEYPSDDDQKPIRVKKEVQNHNSEPRSRYRALLINAEPRHATSPRARESRRSSDNTAMEERLETSKKKLQAGHQDRKRENPKKASTSRSSSKNKTRK